MTCDSLASVQIVTASGQLVTANPSANADLFWACQGGGGGNFGIATSLTYNTFATMSPTLVFLKWPWEAAADVLPAWLAWAPNAPDQLWSNCLLEAVPGSSANLQVGVVWIGPPGGLSDPLDQFIASVGSAPSSRFTETVGFSHAMYVEGGCASLSEAGCHLPTQASGGSLTRQPSLGKSGYVSAPLTDSGVQAIISGVETRQSENAQGAAGFDAYGGAINRVAPSATAFVHRNTLASVQFNVPFDPSAAAADLAVSEAWLNAWYATVAPFLDGQAYQNYIDPNLPNWADAYYGSNLARLRQVKGKWDPDDVFRFAQSIPL
jgi:FAD/FMN-containing dehydrogenase